MESVVDVSRDPAKLPRRGTYLDEKNPLFGKVFTFYFFYLYPKFYYIGLQIINFIITLILCVTQHSYFKEKRSINMYYSCYYVFIRNHCKHTASLFINTCC